MSREITLELHLPLTLYSLEEAAAAERSAQIWRLQVYAWKTSGKKNWLERGLSITDILGFVVLPKGLPDTINLPED